MRILLIASFFSPVQNVCADRPDSIYKYGSLAGVTFDVISMGRPHPNDAARGILRCESIDGWTRSFFRIDKLFFKFCSKFVELFFFNIDFFLYRNVMRESEDFLKGKTYDAIYAVFPHITAILIGRSLAKRLGIPLFTDFTDCIGFDPFIIPRHPVQNMLFHRFEKSIVHASAGVFTIARAYEDYYRNVLGKKEAWNVYNGFDPDDFAHLKKPEPSDGSPIRIVYFGSLSASRRRDVSPLFDALVQLKKDHGVTARNITIRFIGRSTAADRKQVSKRNLNDLISFSGYMDKRDGFSYITENCDYLLFYGMPGLTSSVTSKILEYLRLGKPILGICGGNEAEDIIRKAGAGEVVPFETTAVLALFQRALNRSIQYNPNHSYIETFSRASQTQTILRLISETLNKQAATEHP